MSDTSTVARPRRAAAEPDQPVVRRGRRSWLRRLAGPARRVLAAWWGDIEPYRSAIAHALRPVVLAVSCISPLGWVVLAAALASWVGALVLGWSELAYVAVFAVALLAVASLFAIGRTRLEVELELDPQRVVVGESAGACLRVHNLAATPLPSLTVEFPVGAAVARFALPVLAGGARHEEIVIVPTSHRGVVSVGPVRTQRGDPFGLIRREVIWTTPTEMFVHPRTAPLEPVGAGLLRDLEGHTTNATSMSDLAFHTLREYVSGDDRRYIHWRSSAKLSGASNSSDFLVKQFLDTRRSHIAVVVDVQPESYASPDDFELAISTGASIALRTLTDEMDLTVICGDHATVQPPAFQALDTFSRAELHDVDLARATGRLATLAPDASVVILVTGDRGAFATLRRCKSYLPPEVTTIAIRAAVGTDAGMTGGQGLPVLSIGGLAALPQVLRGVIVQ